MKRKLKPKSKQKNKQKKQKQKYKQTNKKPLLRIPVYSSCHVVIHLCDHPSSARMAFPLDNQKEEENGNFFLLILRETEFPKTKM